MNEEDINVETLDNNEELDNSNFELESPKEIEIENDPNVNNRLRLPLSRIKSIMKNDPDCQLIKKDALILVTKAAELFLESLGKEAYKYSNKTKRKTIMRRDVDAAIESVPNLCFLDGALDSWS